MCDLLLPFIDADRSDAWHLCTKLRPGAAEVSATAESTGIASALGEAKELSDFDDFQREPTV